MERRSKKVKDKSNTGINTGVKYYNLKKINELDCDYNMIIGERSNGKTYACLWQALDLYIQNGIQTAYLRRWSVDLVGKRSQQLFASVLANYDLETKTKGKFNDIYCVGSRWYLCHIDKEKGKKRLDLEPFCFGFSLSEMEHEKGVSYPNIKHIVFDEFLTRTSYLRDEFILFANVLSTIIRDKNDVKIYMLGNTVNRYAPYFTEMGIANIETQKQGTIDVYKFGNEKHNIKIAVEYCSENQSQKESNKYFAFNNSKLEMITNGKWELCAYPHLEVGYKPKDILYIFYIVFGEKTLQGNIILQGSNMFCYIHEKTSKIHENNDRLVFDLVPNPKPNYQKRLLNNNNRICAQITNLFATDKVFYSTNEVGDTVRNYLLCSMKNNLTV